LWLESKGKKAQMPGHLDETVENSGEMPGHLGENFGNSDEVPGHLSERNESHSNGTRVKILSPTCPPFVI
jgi:hypothetical protein